MDCPTSQQRTFLCSLFRPSHKNNFRRYYNAAVGIRNNAICLFINPKFLEKLKHGLRKGFYDAKELPLLSTKFFILFLNIYTVTKNWHPYIANLAADLVVNQYVALAFVEGAILEQFSVLNLNPEETLEYYYS